MCGTRGKARGNLVTYHPESDGRDTRSLSLATYVNLGEKVVYTVSQLTHANGQNLDLLSSLEQGLTTLIGLIPIPSLLQRTRQLSGEWLPAGQRSRSGPEDVLRDLRTEHTVLCRLQE